MHTLAVNCAGVLLLVVATNDGSTACHTEDELAEECGAGTADRIGIRRYSDKNCSYCESWFGGVPSQQALDEADEHCQELRTLSVVCAICYVVSGFTMVATWARRNQRVRVPAAQALMA